MALMENVIDGTVAKDSFVLKGPGVTRLADSVVRNDSATQIFYNVHDVSGLSNEHETQEMHIGGTDATAWIVGVKKKGDITIKRFFQKNLSQTVAAKHGNTYFRDWRRMVSKGSQASEYLRDMLLLVMNKAFTPVLGFKLLGTYPSRIEWDDLGADDSGVWMENIILKISDLIDTDDIAEIGEGVLKSDEPGEEVAEPFALSNDSGFGPAV